MANKELKNIEEFIEGFTRNGSTPENYNYEGVKWGTESLYDWFLVWKSWYTFILIMNEFNQKCENSHAKLYEF